MDILKNNIKLCQKKWKKNQGELSVFFDLGQFGLANIFAGKQKLPEEFVLALSKKAGVSTDDLINREIALSEISEFETIEPPPFNEILGEVRNVSKELHRFGDLQIELNKVNRELKQAHQKIIELQDKIINKNQ